VAVLIDEALNLLESGNDPLFARSPARVLPRFDLDAQLFEQRVVLVGKLSHE
jgi:CHASE2 domain-containing sensor protein